MWPKPPVALPVPETDIVQDPGFAYPPCEPGDRVPG